MRLLVHTAEERTQARGGMQIEHLSQSGPPQVSVNKQNPAALLGQDNCRVCADGGLPFFLQRTRYQQDLGRSGRRRKQYRSPQRPVRLRSLGAWIGTCDQGRRMLRRRSRSRQEKPSSSASIDLQRDRSQSGERRHSGDLFKVSNRRVDRLHQKSKRDSRGEPNQEPDPEIAIHIGLDRAGRYACDIDDPNVAGTESGGDARLLQALKHVEV